jgi:acetyltransferase-like isoleucine patch superfamily enzyme
MVHIHKFHYFLHTLTQDPSELLRLFSIGVTTVNFRYLKRCVGKGTIVEPQTKVINAANVLIGKNCLLKEAVYIRAGTQGRVILGDRVAINGFCKIYGHGSVEIGADTQIGPCTLITTTDHNYHEQLATRYLPVVIGKSVWIGANVTILPGVTIGDRAVIGAGAVVTNAIPADSVAVGVPAKVVKHIARDESSMSIRQNGITKKFTLQT